MKAPDNPMCDTCDARQRSFFCDLERCDLLDVSINKTYNIYKKGQSVFFEGRRPLGVYCLHSGKIKITKNGINGKEQIVRFTLPGDLLGIRALIGGREYSASAIALEDSVICFISKKVFLDILKKYPDINQCVMIYLSRMLEEAENKMTSLAQKPVRERLAEALILLNEIYNRESPTSISREYSICLSREDLASIVGTATESVIRLLSEFKEEKLISANGRRITLLDIRGIKKVGNIFN
ncbi:Crp/Fnr family transcriptional regulator [candidate division KSB1 bacterium]